MKCLCGFKQKPDNIRVIKDHVRDCLTSGYLSNLNGSVSIVWRDGEFTATDEPKKDDRVLETVAQPKEFNEEDLTLSRVNTRWTKEEVKAEKPAPKKKAPAKKK